MSAEVESMAYRNEVPWHKLGTFVADEPSIEDMTAKAGLDWKIQKRPLVTAEGFNLLDESWINFDLDVEGFYALVRATDNRVLDIVGSRYVPVQNDEAMEFFREFVEEGNATLETAGSLKGGRYVWCLANLNESFTLKGKDKVKGYVLLASPHEQGKALIIKHTMIRVVCHNTLSLALKGEGAEFRMAHRQSFDFNSIKRAKDILGLAREEVGKFERNARKLKKLKLKEKDVIRIIAPIMAPKADVDDMVEDFEANATPRMRTIIETYKYAPGADPGTGWGALNAVTYYADHQASRTRDKRLTNAWFGRTARQKEKVLNALLGMAA